MLMTSVVALDIVLYYDLFYFKLWNQYIAETNKNDIFKREKILWTFLHLIFLRPRGAAIDFKLEHTNMN